MKNIPIDVISAVLRQLRASPLQPPGVRGLLPPRAHQTGRPQGRGQGRGGKGSSHILTWAPIR